MTIKAEMLYRVDEANICDFRYFGLKGWLYGMAEKLWIQPVAEGSLETAGRYVNPAIQK